jgi:lipid-binding SYLF domain-containing protein
MYKLRQITCEFRRITLAFSVIGILGGAPLPAAANDASDRAAIDRDVNNAIANMYKSVPGSKELAAKSKGMLIFPSVVKAGVVVGGQYGKGALRVQNRTVAYYSTAAASFGLQLGAQERSMAFLFMTNDALSRFEKSNGWDAGGDASVALLKQGANSAINLSTENHPVVALIYGNTGLMADLSLEGTKVSKLDIGAPSANEATGSSTE